MPDGTPTASSQPHLPARSDSIVSPRAAALYHFTDRVTAWGSVAAGYRAPTLNELYRSFRVGTTFTLANPDLAAERLRGGEVGVSLAPARGLTWRATLFDTRLHHPVSNVTVSQSGANVTLQRKNLGRTRTLGLQTDVEYLFGSAWRITGAYQYAHATVLEYQAPVIDPDDLSEDLVGKFLPQVAKHRGSVLVVYTRPRVIDLSVSLQVTGNQYDDDRNVRGVPGQPAPGLPGYAVLSFTASRPIDRTFELFVGMQNVLNHEYFVGTLPTLVGPPRMVNAGVRVSFRGR